MRPDRQRRGRVAGWLAALVVAGTPAAAAHDAGTSFRVEQPSGQVALFSAGLGKPAVWGSRSDPRVAASRANAAPAGGLAAEYLTPAGGRAAAGWWSPTGATGVAGLTGHGWPHQGRAPPLVRA